MLTSVKLYASRYLEGYNDRHTDYSYLTNTDYPYYSCQLSCIGLYLRVSSLYVSTFMILPACRYGMKAPQLSVTLS